MTPLEKRKKELLEMKFFNESGIRGDNLAKVIDQLIIALDALEKVEKGTKIDFDFSSEERSRDLYWYEFVELGEEAISKICGGEE